MSEERIPTSEKLAQALEAAGAPQEMIEKARAKYYERNASLSDAMQLAFDARLYGLDAIADRAINGEFGTVTAPSGIKLIGVKVKYEGQQ